MPVQHVVVPYGSASNRVSITPRLLQPMVHSGRFDVWPGAGSSTLPRRASLTLNTPSQPLGCSISLGTSPLYSSAVVGLYRTQTLVLTSSWAALPSRAAQAVRRAGVQHRSATQRLAHYVRTSVSSRRCRRSTTRDFFGGAYRRCTYAPPRTPRLCCASPAPCTHRPRQVHRDRRQRALPYHTCTH